MIARIVIGAIIGALAATCTARAEPPTCQQRSIHVDVPELEVAYYVLYAVGDGCRSRGAEGIGPTGDRVTTHPRNVEILTAAGVMQPRDLWAQ